MPLLYQRQQLGAVPNNIVVWWRPVLAAFFCDRHCFQRLASCSKAIYRVLVDSVQTQKVRYYLEV